MMLKCFLFSDLIPKMTLILLLLSKSLFFYIIDTTLKCLPFCSLPSELGVRGPRKGFLTVSHSPHLFLYPSLLRPGLGLWPLPSALPLYSSLARWGRHCHERQRRPPHPRDSRDASELRLALRATLLRKLKQAHQTSAKTFSEGSGGFKLDPTVMNPLTVLTSGEKN